MMLVGKPNPPPVERTDIDMEAEVKVQPLTAALRRDIRKARAYRGMPIYLFYLTALTMVPWVSRLSNSRYNELYHLEKANRQELDVDHFTDHVHDVNDFWDWFSTTAIKTHGLGSNYTTGGRLQLAQVSNYPVGYVLMRQFRVERSRCIIPTVVRQSLEGKILDCHGEWEDGSQSIEPYGPADANGNPAWKPGGGVSVVAVSTMFHSYSSTDNAFAIKLPLPPISTDVDDMRNNITFLKDNNWIDASSRVVIVDILTFNPSIDAFALNHFFIEFFATGSSEAGQKAYPFDLLNFGAGSSYFQFFLDIVAVVCNADMAISVLVSGYRSWEMGLNFPWIGPFDFFDVGFVIFLSHALYFRMLLWRDGPDLHDGPELELNETFESLFAYGYDYERSNTYVGISVVFAWIRLFRFLQFNSRLGVLSETVANASADLISIFLIFIIVLVGYGIGGSALYGVDHKNFSSWWLAISYLLRLLISAEVDQHYDELKVIHPDWTGLYMSSFMVITWVILLNMILAIITGSFVSVQENNKIQRDPWTVKMFRKDANKLCKRLRPTCMGKDKGYCRTRIILIKKLSAYTEEMRAKSIPLRDQFISLKVWLERTLDEVDETTAIRIFERVLMTSGGDAAQIKIGTRFATSMKSTIGLVQRSINRLDEKLANSINANEQRKVTVDCSTQTDLKPVPPINGEYQQRTQEKKLKQQKKDKTRSARRNKLHQLSAQNRSFSNSYPQQPAAVIPPRRTYSGIVFSSHEDGMCTSPGCSNTIVEGSQYCGGHLCPSCNGAKASRYQSVCVVCECNDIYDEPKTYSRLPTPKKQESIDENIPTYGSRFSVRKQSDPIPLLSSSTTPDDLITNSDPSSPLRRPLHKPRDGITTIPSSGSYIRKPSVFSGHSGITPTSSSQSNELPSTRGDQRASDAILSYWGQTNSPKIIEMQELS